MLVIRVLRDGVPVREELFRSTPVSIGRSSSSQLVLTDPSVSRDHARIERGADGSLVIIDGAGTNGLYAGPRRVSSERFTGRLRARLGLAEIEIEEVSNDATQPVSLEDLHRLDQRRTPLTWAKYITITLAALTLQSLMAPEFWSPWNSERAVGMVWQNATLLVVVMVFASILLGLLKAAGRKVRMADVLHHFAVFAWLAPLAAAICLLGYYVLQDALAAPLRSWLPSLAAVAFLTQAAAVRRPAPNRTFRLWWTAALLLVLTGIDFTRAYGARRLGQPEVDHTMQAPIPLLGPGPAITFEAFGARVEAAGRRSEDQVR